jgi:hypothetical protein
MQPTPVKRNQLCVHDPYSALTQCSTSQHPSHLTLSALPCWIIAVGCSLLAGCGPAPSDNASSLESRVSGPSFSEQGLSPRNDRFTPAASPLPLASVDGTASALGTGAVPGGGSLRAGPVLSSEPGHPVEGLVVPDWMAQKLNSPNVRVRLKSLETWAQSAPP